MASLAVAAWNDLGIDEDRWRRQETRYGEGGSGRQQDEVACADGDGFVPVDGLQATALQHNAEARLPIFGVAHSPVAFAADDLGKGRARMQKPDYFGKRVTHIC